MTVYEQLLKAVEKGTPFSVSLEDSSLRVGKHWLIQNGNYDGELIEDSGDGDDVLQHIEELYREYKYSVPHQNSRRSRYFKALKSDDLTITQLAYGKQREMAQAALEGYVLCMKILGKIQFADGWFWQSKKDKDLVILKKWL